MSSIWELIFTVPEEESNVHSRYQRWQEKGANVIQVWVNLDRYVAEGSFSLTSLFKPIAHDVLHLEHKMRMQTTIGSAPHLALLCITNPISFL